MGGDGSGRQGAASGTTTEGCRSIAIRHWQREGLLIAERAFSWRWRLSGGEVKADIRVQATNKAVKLAYKHRRGGGP